MQSDTQVWIDTIRGQSISKVRYFECLGSTEPHWNMYNPLLDSVELGIELETDTGQILSIVWEQLNSEVGLSLNFEPLQSYFNPTQIWDVTEVSRWASLTPPKIKDVLIGWAFEHNGANTIAYPQDLAIVFEGNRRVYIEVRPGFWTQR